ncbi:HAD family hydrolase [Alkalihalobacillus pseudalcaliphilus]|uniref:HAD family hydrolase n=1 Tax=Alkalihalobacillus pseudalcaliphilus TaxID=79884 RepID=UPI00064DFDAE|nr:HAD family hydrolase [Alkalihalobacillus pseudalcaliphilus]KMK75673.1 haloacid dehalogenase [Alkalihalobacillus pseudalcaliphilus]
MTYRLLAINMDGALLESDTKMSKQTKAAIEYVKNKGVKIVLITSKPYLSAHKVAKALKINDYLICSDGAYMAKSNEDILLANRITEVQCEEIIDILERFDCHIRVFNEQYSLGNKVKNKGQMVAKLSINLDEPRFYPLNFVDSVYDHVVDYPISPLKIQAQFANKEDLKKAVRQIENMEQPFTIRQSQDSKIELLQKGVSRGKALRYLVHSYGISMEEVVTVCASESDYEMMIESGLGVAMGNAPSRIKSHAKWLTRSKDDQGFAYMVREVFRKQLKVEI